MGGLSLLNPFTAVPAAAYLVSRKDVQTFIDEGRKSKFTPEAVKVSQNVGDALEKATVFMTKWNPALPVGLLGKAGNGYTSWWGETVKSMVTDPFKGTIDEGITHIPVVGSSNLIAGKAADGKQWTVQDSIHVGLDLVTFSSGVGKAGVQTLEKAGVEGIAGLSEKTSINHMVVRNIKVGSTINIGTNVGLNVANSVIPDSAPEMPITSFANKSVAVVAESETTHAATPTALASAGAVGVAQASEPRGTHRTRIYADAPRYNSTDTQKFSGQGNPTAGRIEQPQTILAPTPSAVMQQQDIVKFCQQLSTNPAIASVSVRENPEIQINRVENNQLQVFVPSQISPKDIKILDVAVLNMINDPALDSAAAFKFATQLVDPAVAAQPLKMA